MLNTVDQQVSIGAKDITILISSRGGHTTSGHTAYNYLKALPINLTTWNIGLVGSAALNIFCAGRQRFAVPDSKFWLHCTDWTFQSRSYELPEVRGIAAEMESDLLLSAQIIAANTSLDEESISRLMCGNTHWATKEAKKFELIRDIKVSTIEKNIITIQ
ncbi:MAG TPA: ATP-dependent Clp protease proteolytic subunit [Abditibacteriaceae bacterium]